MFTHISLLINVTRHVWVDFATVDGGSLHGAGADRFWNGYSLC